MEIRSLYQQNIILEATDISAMKHSMAAELAGRESVCAFRSSY